MANGADCGATQARAVGWAKARSAVPTRHRIGSHSAVMRGLDPRIPLRETLCPPMWDGRPSPRRGGFGRAGGTRCGHGVGKPARFMRDNPMAEKTSSDSAPRVALEQWLRTEGVARYDAYHRDPSGVRPAREVFAQLRRRAAKKKLSGRGDRGAQ